MAAPNTLRKIADDMIMVEHLPFDADGGIASRARIGLIVLATDYTIEHEWRRIMSGLPGVALYRAGFSTTADHHARNFARDGAAHCRCSGRTHTARRRTRRGGLWLHLRIHGDRRGEGLRQYPLGAALVSRCTTPITAAFAAFRAFGARRIGVLTPYRADVNRIVADYIRARGFDVPVFGSFNEENEAKVARISPAAIRAGIDADQAARSG